MVATASITVTSGPDCGKSFALASDVVRLGRGPENEIVFSDPQMGEHQASIIHRDGRYAIVTASPDGLEIDGTEVPPERWVWLPDGASIRVSRMTRIQFATGEANSAPASVPGTSAPTAAPPLRVEPAAAPAAAEPRQKPAARPQVKPARPVAAVPKPPGSTDAIAPQKKGGEKPDRKRAVARFITETPGETLVKLGEDGHLPELTLAEGRAAASRAAAERQSNPVVMIALMATSMGATLLLLLSEGESSASLAQAKAAARAEIREYYSGEEDAPLEPYQLALRRAHQAHTRRDRAAERDELRKVLMMLRSESKPRHQKFTGLTGRLDYDFDSPSKRSDKRLEELIAVLLAEE
jgi:hypothetical protein